ncbi:surface antigen-domain-containing protein [Spinellus fusiger]|nr:surface antigen-domain-containing protein [Spinellus fusiger]
METPHNLHPEAPLSVNTLEIFGVSATRPSFLNKVTQGLFQAQSTQQVLKSVNAMASQLDRLDIFEKISVHLDTDPRVADSVNIRMQVKEKPRGVYRTSLAVSDNDAGMRGSVSARNVLGGAETVAVQYSFGHHTKSQIEASVSTPLRASANTTLEAFVGSAVKDYSFINAYEEQAKTAGVRFKTGCVHGHYQVTAGIALRDITAFPSASGLVRAHSSKNQKTFLAHTFVRDTRDEKSLPRRGYCVRLSQEVAGEDMSGQVHYLKQEANLHHHMSFFNEKQEYGVTVTTGVRGGLLAALSESSVNVSDRFYVGGPLSVRGFKSGGIGPRHGNDAVGGDVYWEAGISVMSTVPGAVHWPVRLHGFVNAGNLIEWSKSKSCTKRSVLMRVDLDMPVGDTLKALRNSPCTSAGVGLLFQYGTARAEVNLCMPMTYTATDRPMPGLQLGVGLDFL